MQVLYSRTESKTTLRFGGKKVCVEEPGPQCVYFVEGTRFAEDNEAALELNGKFYKLLPHSSLPVAGCVKTDVGYVGLCSASNTAKTPKYLPIAPVLVGVGAGLIIFSVFGLFTKQSAHTVVVQEEKQPIVETFFHKALQKVWGSGANTDVAEQAEGIAVAGESFSDEANEARESSKNKKRRPKPTNIDTTELEKSLALETVRVLNGTSLNVPSGTFTVQNPLWILRNTTAERLQVTVSTMGKVVWASFVDSGTLSYFNVYDKLEMDYNHVEISIKGSTIDENYQVGVWLK